MKRSISFSFGFHGNNLPKNAAYIVFDEDQQTAYILTKDKQEIQLSTGANVDVTALKDELKAYTDSKITAVFTYKGTKPAVADLPTTAKVGDVYVIGEAEYAYTGSTWQKLGTTTDLSLYALQSDVYTKSEADNKFLTEHQSLSAYLTATDADNTFVKPATTLSGYGIIDAYTKSEADNKFLTEHQSLSAYLTTVNADNTFAKQTTTLSGYGITDAYTKSEADNKFLTEHQSLSAYLTAADADSTFVKPATTLSGYGVTDAYTKTEIDDKGYLTEHQDISTKLDNVLSGHTDEIITAKQSGQIQNSGMKIGSNTLPTLITNEQLRQNIIDELEILQDSGFDIQVGSDFKGRTNQSGSIYDTIRIQGEPLPGKFLIISYIDGQWVENSHVVFPSPEYYDIFTYITAEGILSAQLLIDELETDGSISKAGKDIPENIINGTDYTEIKIKTLSDNVIHTFGIGMASNGAATQLAVVKELNNKANKGTTLAEYGIVNTYTKDEADGTFLTNESSLDITKISYDNTGLSTVIKNIQADINSKLDTESDPVFVSMSGQFVTKAELSGILSATMSGYVENVKALYEGLIALSGALITNNILTEQQLSGVTIKVDQYIDHNLELDYPTLDDLLE